MVSEALIIHMLSTWSGYGVFGPRLLLLQKVVGAMVSMVSDGLDLGGRGFLWDRLVWTWAVGATVSMVSGSVWSGEGVYGV